MLLAAYDADRGKSAVMASCGRGAKVIGICPAESQQGTLAGPGSLGQIVFELAPLVARYIRVDQVVPLKPQFDA